MKITVLVTLMVFLAYFLVLYGGVGFIQDKRFFSSAPKENLDAIPDTKERFPGAHSIGWVIEIIAILLFLAAAALSVGGRRQKRLRLPGLLCAVSRRALRHGDLRHHFL